MHSEYCIFQYLVFHESGLFQSKPPPSEDIKTKSDNITTPITMMIPLDETPKCLESDITPVNMDIVEGKSKNCKLEEK